MLSKWILLFILPTYFMITIKVIFLNQCTLIICPICTSLICSAWFHQFWRSLWTNVGIIIMLYNKPDYIFWVDYWLSNERYLETWEWSLAMSWWIVCLLSSWKLDQNLVLGTFYYDQIQRIFSLVKNYLNTTWWRANL